MDYAPNPRAHLLPPTKQTRYPAPSIAHWPPDSSIPHYNAPPTAHAPRTPSLSHYSAPPFRTTPPPYDAPPPAHSYTSTVASGYSAPTPVENLPPTDIPRYVVPEAYSSDTNVVQQSAPRQSYGFSSAYYTNPSSHYSEGYDPYPDPYATHSTHPGSGYSVSGYSYQRPAYQYGGYDPYGYPQVANRGTTQYPQYPPPAKVGPGPRPRPRNPKPKHKKPKPITTDNYCQICKIRCSAAEDLGVHRQGKKHQRNVQKLQGAITPMIGPQPKKTDDLPKSPSQPAERKRKSMPTGPASLDELDVKKKRAKLAVVLPNPWNPKPKHKKPKPVTTDNYCQICKIGCSTAKDLGVHRQGKKHQRNVQKLQGAITPMIGPQPKKTDDLPKSPSQPAERKRKSMPTGPASLDELEVKKKRVYDAGAPVDGVRVCGVCNIVVNCQKVFDLHCAGSKHAMMLKRLQEGS